MRRSICARFCARCPSREPYVSVTWSEFAPPATNYEVRTCRTFWFHARLRDVQGLETWEILLSQHPSDRAEGRREAPYDGGPAERGDNRRHRWSCRCVSRTVFLCPVRLEVIVVFENLRSIGSYARLLRRDGHLCDRRVWEIERRRSFFRKHSRSNSDDSSHLSEHAVLVLQIHEHRHDGLRVHGSTRRLLQIRHVLRAGEKRPLRPHPVKRKCTAFSLGVCSVFPSLVSIRGEVVKRANSRPTVRLGYVARSDWKASSRLYVEVFRTSTT